MLECLRKRLTKAEVLVLKTGGWGDSEAGFVKLLCGFDFVFSKANRSDLLAKNANSAKKILPLSESIFLE